MKAADLDFCYLNTVRLHWNQHRLAVDRLYDGLGCLTFAASMGAVHDRGVTGGRRASVLNEKFRAVNTLIGNVKTVLTGTYHAVKFGKYRYRHLTEVQFRLSRGYDIRALLGGLLRAPVATPKQPSVESGLLRRIANHRSPDGRDAVLVQIGL